MAWVMQLLRIGVVLYAAFFPIKVADAIRTLARYDACEELREQGMQIRCPPQPRELTWTLATTGLGIVCFASGVATFVLFSGPSGRRRSSP